MPLVRVLGLGNVLMQDDGFGPFVVEYLHATYTFPAGVEVLDVGTPGLDLTPFVTGADAIVILDTVRSAGAPGEIRCYRKDQVLAHAPQQRVSPHDPGLKEALLSAEFEGRGAPDVLLVGAIPEAVGFGAVLTPALRAAVPAAAAAVVEELARLGVPAARRPDASPPQPWWTAAPEAP
jgi:hydrogenase maturation protease